MKRNLMVFVYGLIILMTICGIVNGEVQTNEAQEARIKERVATQTSPQIALVYISPYSDYVTDDLDYLGYSYDSYDEDNIQDLFSNNKILEYKVLLISYFAATSQLYSTQSSVIHDAFIENTAI
ncbi:MAG: hypothetical protein KKE96_06920, partial [Candidatus Altiarchaeota archaeon]|nr:hypothetical protein [Candidatus Altiarchaeota archaeon]